MTEQVACDVSEPEVLPKDLLARWRGYTPPACPLCGSLIEFEAAPCPSCGAWWRQLGLVRPAFLRKAPADLLPGLLDYLKLMPGIGSVLDVGGGGGIVAYPYWYHQVSGNNVHVLDIFPPETALTNFTLGDGVNATKIYGAKSFDAVQCTDVLEHLEKPAGHVLLDVLKEVARRFVLITTPNGFLGQDPRKHPEASWAKNPYQLHVSGWTPSELEQHGYTVTYNGPGPGGAMLFAWHVEK